MRNGVSALALPALSLPLRTFEEMTGGLFVGLPVCLLGTSYFVAVRQHANLLLSPSYNPGVSAKCNSP